MSNQLHNDVLKFAENYRIRHPEFRYALRKANRKNRLSDGLWFQGTENYVFLGLINRSGGTNMTKSVGLVFRPNGDDVKCNVEIVFNEETDSAILNFYSKLRELIGGFEKIHENKYKKVLASENGFEAAAEFLDNAKPKIDSLIQEMGLQRVMITKEDFEESQARINEFKTAAANSPNYWLFQGNPKIFDFESAIKADAIESWTVSAYKDKIKPGDKVILWLTGTEPGCYALAEITSEPFERKPSPDDLFYKKEDKSKWQVGIQITHNLIEKPILSKDIKNHEAFKNIKAGHQGTNFTSTRSEFEAFIKLADGGSDLKRQYWLIAPGQHANMWEEFYMQGIIAIGWKVGDLKQYNNQEEVERVLEKNAKVDKDHRINAQQCFEFGHEIKLNDIIIAKKGMSEYLGWGIVSEEYSYHPEKNNYQNSVKVDWKSKGSWEGEIQQRKTVGNITDNAKLKSVLNLLGINSSEEDSSFLQHIKQFDKGKLDFYFEKLRELIKEFNIQYNDTRVTFSTRSKRLNFIVGQRIGFNLENKRGITEFRFISSSKLPTFDVAFDGPPTAFLNRTADTNDINLYASDIRQSISAELSRTKYSGYQDSDNKEFRSYIFGQPLIPYSKSSLIPKYSLNTILYGPPGTGKTYMSIMQAAKIVTAPVEVNDYNTALRIFNENLGDKIEFITFHQNYSYEEFIQGLRPDTDNSNSLLFKKRDGIFKRIADRALDNLIQSEQDPEQLSNEAKFNVALEALQEKIEETGANFPINDKTYISEVDEDAFRYTGANWTAHASGIRMKFSDLREFYKNGVEHRKDIKKLISISSLARQHATYYFLVYKKILELIPKTITTTITVDKKNYVIIIDEINRANISRVFGELITLIEPDKRSHGKIPLQVTLPSGDKFMVPSNLYIIGTMNTADKSIALLDIALRRRFTFESMYPKYDIKGYSINDPDILDKLNEHIKVSKGHDFQIGHAYFMEEEYNLINCMNNKVIPLLLEYYMNSEKDVKELLKKTGLQVEEGTWPLRILGRRDESV